MTMIEGKWKGIIKTWARRSYPCICGTCKEKRDAEHVEMNAQRNQRIDNMKVFSASAILPWPAPKNIHVIKKIRRKKTKEAQDARR